MLQPKEMKFIAYTCVSFFIVSLICPGISAEKPRMIPGGEDLYIQEGDELRLECRGRGRLHFSQQKLILPFKQSKPKISSGENPRTLIISNATGEDTGWYACAEEGIHIRNDEQVTNHSDGNISWIYVWVNSTEPFAVSGSDGLPRLVTAVAKGRVVIPCRPTNRQLDVKLYKNFYEEIPVENDVSYSPRIGFIMKNIDRAEHGTPFLCKIGAAESINPSYDLIVTASVDLSDRDVKTESKVLVVLGGNLTLQCNITVSQGTNVTLNWQAPPSVPGKRLSQSGNSSTENLETTFTQSLTVTNIKLSDGGRYICDAKSADKAESGTDVIVSDPAQPHINYTVQNDNYSIREYENQTAIWKMDITTYPMNPTLYWFKDGNMLKYSRTDSQSKYYLKVELLTHTFKISNVNIHDSGNYTVQVNTSDCSETIQLQLTALVKPVPVIQNILPYYEPGASADILCNATGSPLPNVTWSFSKWQSEENAGSTEPREILYPRNESVSTNGHSLISDLYKTIDVIGNLTCTSCNTVGCTDSTEMIFISDGVGFFGTFEQNPVVVGDNVTLTCAASVYNYANETEWKFEDSMSPELDEARMKIYKLKTNFTHRSILEIHNVTTRDAGTYYCEAISKAGRIDGADRELSVIEASKPSIYRTSMSNSRISISFHDRWKPINLTCFIDGQPPPKLTWLKDGKPLVRRDHTHSFVYSYTLCMQNLMVEDTGNYSCIAENRLGRVEKYEYITVEEQADGTTIWISLICVLIIIIIVVITYMAVRMHRERVRNKELCEAGLTHFVDGAVECLNPDLTVDDQAELLPYDKKWEFPRELLKLGKQLGSGAFGVVMKAEARGICVEGEVTTVAVKMVRRSAEPSYMRALSSELKIMIHLGQHLNVVNLLGACTKTILSKRELYVIVEYCRYGNLHNYLQRHRSSFIDQIDPPTQIIDPNIGLELLIRSESMSSENRRARITTQRSISIMSSNLNSASEFADYRQGPDYGDVNMSPDGAILSNNSVQPGWRSNYRGDYKEQNLPPICTQDLLCWAWQVSRGMEYLSSRNVLHGDLAARNILLADDNIVKICDFGLAKTMYKDNNYKKKGDSPLPIKWMAIESIRDRIFSTQSDVWSFGIVLWEFFTLARTPYPGMEAEKQYDRLIEGYRMEKPEYATQEIYEFMLHCWKAKPSLRPSFPELAEKIGTLLNEGIKMRYLDMNTQYMEMNIKALQDGQNDYLTMMSAPDHEYHDSPNVDSPEMNLGSDYLPMSPINKTNDACIFSPRPEPEELHFDFPPPNQDTLSNSDPQDILQAAAEMPKSQSPDEINKDVRRQGKDDLMHPGEERILIEKESGDSTVTNNQNYVNLGNRNSNNVKDSNRSPNGIRFQKDSEKLSLPINVTENNYVNMPKKKPSPVDGPQCDSFSNPSYVIMSK